jgi:hypothetical protein
MANGSVLDKGTEADKEAKPFLNGVPQQRHFAYLGGITDRQIGHLPSRCSFWDHVTAAFDKPGRKVTPQALRSRHRRQGATSHRSPVQGQCSPPISPACLPLCRARPVHMAAGPNIATKPPNLFVRRTHLRSFSETSLFETQRERHPDAL